MNFFVGILSAICNVSANIASRPISEDELPIDRVCVRKLLKRCKTNIHNSIIFLMVEIFARNDMFNLNNSSIC